MKLTDILKRVLPPKWVNYIKQARLRSSIAAFKSKIVRHSYCGHNLDVHIQDILAEAWYDQDWMESSKISFLRLGKLKAGAKVFDLGAHQGIVAMILAREVWPNGKVIAVEGTGHNAEIARRNLELNAVKNVEIINAVIGEKDGDKVMFSNTLNGSVSIGGVGESVDSVTIDTLALRHGVPDVVFVDVEGYECQALSGASAVLNSNTDFLIEVHEGCGLQDHGNKELVLSFFQPSRFHCFISFPEGAPFERWFHGNALPEARFFLIARSI